MLFDVRPDIKILANSFVAAADEICERCLPVDVFSNSTSPTNLKSVRRATVWLRQGHGVAIFPAGEVSHWQPEQRCVTDPAWFTLAARFALHTEATVMPVYFAGANSVAFHIAGMVHPRLRTLRLPRELLNKRGRIVEIRIGTPISATELAKQGSPKNATNYLRACTYMLGCRKSASRAPSPAAIVRCVTSLHRPPVAAEIPGVAEEISRLEKEGRKILENGSYAVFAERGAAMPVLLREIGRLRELTFRAAGEGTRKALDLDSFDPYYSQLVLWHKNKSCVAGGYRLAWTQDVLPERGFRGLYTSTLFRFAPAFFEAIGPAVELGRTFIREEFQKEYAPLMLLWQAIGRCIVSRPDAPVLFGPVSISAAYSDAAMELIVQYMRQHRLRADVAGFVTPRRPFRARLTRAADLRLVAACLHDIEDLSVPLAEIDGNPDVPVLLRQYVRLGGRVAAFNVDRNFSNVVDGLLIVNLRETSPKLLAKYVGGEAATAFLREPRRVSTG